MALISNGVGKCRHSSWVLALRGLVARNRAGGGGSVVVHILGVVRSPLNTLCGPLQLLFSAQFCTRRLNRLIGRLSFRFSVEGFSGWWVSLAAVASVGPPVYLSAPLSIVTFSFSVPLLIVLLSSCVLLCFAAVAPGFVAFAVVVLFHLFFLSRRGGLLSTWPRRRWSTTRRRCSRCPTRLRRATSLPSQVNMHVAFFILSKLLLLWTP